VGEEMRLACTTNGITNTQKIVLEKPDSVTDETLVYMGIILKRALKIRNVLTACN
jgi:hypothetical protein